jgi:hypothetical protein
VEEKGLTSEFRAFEVVRFRTLIVGVFIVFLIENSLPPQGGILC